MSAPWTRRRFVTATVTVLGCAGVATSGAADDGRAFALEQAGECYPVVPLSGDEPVEEWYGWGRGSRQWSSAGTRERQRSETSILFLYRGPRGLSLVVVHGRAGADPPGAASFTFEGVPDGAEWAVADDLYDAPTNVDRWTVGGTVLDANESADGGGNGTSPEDGTDGDTRTDEIDWLWDEGRTDGGALRGLAVDGLELRIEAAFDDDAALADEPNLGGITSWELLSGDTDDPDRTELDPDEPVTLRAGTCGADAERGTDGEAATEAEPNAG